MQAWIRNIGRVATEARELAGASDVALVGLRIGATLALHAAAALGGVNRLVLWSPFRSGRAYVRELKAFSRLSRKDYVTQTDQGPDILAAGYVLPGRLRRSSKDWISTRISSPSCVPTFSLSTEMIAGGSRAARAPGGPRIVRRLRSAGGYGRHARAAAAWLGSLMPRLMPSQIGSGTRPRRGRVADAAATAAGCQIGARLRLS